MRPISPSNIPSKLLGIGGGQSADQTEATKKAAHDPQTYPPAPPPPPPPAPPNFNKGRTPGTGSMERELRSRLTNSKHAEKLAKKNEEKLEQLEAGLHKLFEKIDEMSVSNKDDADAMQYIINQFHSRFGDGPDGPDDPNHPENHKNPPSGDVTLREGDKEKMKGLLQDMFHKTRGKAGMAEARTELDGALNRFNEMEALMLEVNNFMIQSQNRKNALSNQQVKMADAQTKRYTDGSERMSQM